MTRILVIDSQRVNAKLLLRIFKCAIHHTLYVYALCTRAYNSRPQMPMSDGSNESLKKMRTKRNRTKMERHFPPLKKHDINMKKLQRAIYV